MWQKIKVETEEATKLSMASWVRLRILHYLLGVMRSCWIMLTPRMMLEELHLKHLTIIAVGKTNRSGVKVGHQRNHFCGWCGSSVDGSRDKDLGGGRGDGEKWAEVKSVFEWNDRTQ